MSSPSNAECKFCGTIVPSDELLAHLRRCDYRDVICSDCKELVPLNNFEAHQDFECRMKPNADEHEKFDSDDEDNIAKVQPEASRTNNSDIKVKLENDEPSRSSSGNRNNNTDNYRRESDDQQSKRKRSRSRSNGRGRSDSRSRGLKVDAPTGGAAPFRDRNGKHGNFDVGPTGRERNDNKASNFDVGPVDALPPIIYPNGNHYTGERMGTTREGKGVLVCIDKGETFDGYWHEDKMSGFGTARYRTGGEYRGMWFDGKRDGHGVEHSTNGNQYCGEFKRGLKHGKGMMRYAEGGSSYDGEWANGRHEGYGVLWTQGILYRGEFREGKKDGRGTTAFPNGNLQEQLWVAGRQQR